MQPRESPCCTLVSDDSLCAYELPKVHRTFSLLCWSHPRGKCDSDQNSLRRNESADSLAPRFFLVFDKHSMTPRFKFRRRLLYVFYIELEPSLRGRNVAGPGIFSKT